jgi:diguanylate cyclase (GGDEF)-like protein/PAS domain S-box-containing protein
MDTSNVFELARLQDLQSYKILDTPPEADFDRLTRLAARICDIQIATVTFVDEQRLWFKSQVGLDLAGLDLRETTRVAAFCTHAISDAKPFIVPDTQKDPLFTNNPLVLGKPGLRFYAGIPLISPRGFGLGTLAVMDLVPRTLTDEQLEALGTLAEQVMVQLELRRQQHILADMAAEQDRVNIKLLHQTEHLEEVQRIAHIGTWELRVQENRLLWSDEIYRIFGIDREGFQENFESFMSFVHPDDREKLLAEQARVMRGKGSLNIQHRIIRRDGQVRYVQELAELVEDEIDQTLILSGTVQDITMHKQDEDELRRLAARLTTTLESITDGFFTLDREWRFTYLNKEAERLLQRTQADLMGKVLWDEFKEAVSRDFYREYHRAVAENCKVSFEEFYPPLNKWFTVNAYPSSEGLAVYFQDISIQRAAEDQLKLLETCVARLNDIVLITETEPFDEPGPRIVFVNDAFERRTGYSREEVIGKTPRILQGPKTQRAELDRIRTALQKWEPVRAELINYKKNGEEFWLELEIVPVADSTGWFTHWVAIERDITQRKVAEEEIKHLAFFDYLTHLPNRRLLLNRLKQTLASNARNKRQGALLFIDLDNFKTLNDTLGHDKGDQLLKQVAERLTKCVREIDTVARLGGDEFVVMLVELNENLQEAVKEAKIVGERILASFNQPYQLHNHEYHSTPSIGVTLFSDYRDTLDELLKRADLAMYQAKAAGRNTMRFFDPDMQTAVSVRVSLEEELQQGLQHKEFSLYYQVQVDSAGNVTGAEALVRWQHPRRGRISPVEFISLAEETGLIIPLGHWVLETACAQLVDWAARPEMANLSLAVNVSARQFRHPEFVYQVLDVLQQTGADPQKLKLELTESLLLDNVEDTIAKMSALKAQGVGFSLDDFGTGYSSLSYLKRLPLDQLKIDKSFVNDVLTNSNDAAIARTIVALGQSLGLAVIAEGVETEAQHEFLASHGCHAYQGYLFSEPLPLDHFKAFVLSKK